MFGSSLFITQLQNMSIKVAFVADIEIKTPNHQRNPAPCNLDELIPVW
jgi:hypothetical protein